MSFQTAVWLLPAAMSPRSAVSAGLDGLVADLGADDLEVDHQPLLVLDDLRLSRGNGQVLGRPVTGVDDQQPEIERHRRLDLGGEGVVAEHVALLEVVQHEAGVGIHRDGRGQQRRDDLQPAVGIDVAEHSADAIDGWLLGRRVAVGDDGVLGRAASQRGERAGAVNGRQAGQFRAADGEAVARRGPRVVADVELDTDLLEARRVVAAVVDLERAEEGRAGHDGLLVDANADLGADALAAFEPLGAASRWRPGPTFRWSRSLPRSFGPERRGPRWPGSASGRWPGNRSSRLREPARR